MSGTKQAFRTIALDALTMRCIRSVVDGWERDRIPTEQALRAIRAYLADPELTAEWPEDVILP